MVGAGELRRCGWSGRGVCGVVVVGRREKERREGASEREEVMGDIKGRRDGGRGSRVP